MGCNTSRDSTLSDASSLLINPLHYQAIQDHGPHISIFDGRLMEGMPPSRSWLLYQLAFLPKHSILKFTMSTPIRLAIIGLSSSAVTSWASSAHLPYLLSPRGRTKYNIVALCNSSIESAKKAIDTYGLDVEKTRAYGNPQALAADPDVDLVLCCTRVDTHYDLIKPSVKAGKAVFVEWPLTHDVARSRELADLAAEKGILTMVGLQGRLAPVVLKLKDILQSGGVGKILSSEVRAHGGTVDRETIAEGLEYFAEKKIGGNVFMIGFAHSKLFPFCEVVLVL